MGHFEGYIYARGCLHLAIAYECHYILASVAELLEKCATSDVRLWVVYQH